VSSTPDQTHIHFANGHDGWATDGETLVASHDGASSWRRVRLPGAVGSLSISKLASTDRSIYAIVVSGAGSAKVTQLYSSPLGEDAWQPVAGVSVPGSAGWDIATHGSAVSVALGVIHTSLRMWSAADGQTWNEVQPVCSEHDAVRLSSTKAGSVAGMCSSLGDRPGHMVKQLVESVQGGAPVVMGQAPEAGNTTGFTTAPDGTAAVAGVGAGASWLYASFDNGATWETPLVLPDAQLPMLDLSFQNAAHGVVLWGGSAWSRAAIYRTLDGGHTWSQLPL
jgi:hypothetical protein